MYTWRLARFSQWPGAQIAPSRVGNGTGSTVVTTSGRPTFAYHSKSTSGHTVHANAGIDALASAAVAKPAEMMVFMLMIDPPNVGVASPPRYGKRVRISAGSARFLRSALAVGRCPQRKGHGVNRVLVAPRCAAEDINRSRACEGNAKPADSIRSAQRRHRDLRGAEH